MSLRQVGEQTGNGTDAMVPTETYRRKGTARERNGMNRDRRGYSCLRSRHFASRIVSPVAIQSDHTPFDTPEHPDHVGVLADRVVHSMFAPVRDCCNGGAEAARDRVGRPWPECDFPHPLIANDLQTGIPEPAFLLREAVGDGFEAGLAWTSYAVITRANQIKALFKPA